MRNLLTLVVGAIVVVVLLAYGCAYQVRYDQVAVKTFFGKADAGSLVTEPGLKLRYFYPINEIHYFPKKLQILEDQLEEQLTKDQYSVIVRTYVAWRIDNASEFFIKVNNVDNARKQLAPQLRSLREVFTKYRFDELVNNDPAKLRLADLEKEATEALRTQVAGAGYGIKIEHVGVRRILLPEKVTEKVFEQMRNTRERMAANIRSTGQAQATAIRSQADSAKRTILSFAERRALAIKAEGDRKAAQYYEAFKDDQEFAIFLRRIEALKKMLASNTTFVLDADQVTPWGLFAHDPGQDAPVPKAKP